MNNAYMHSLIHAYEHTIHYLLCNPIVKAVTLRCCIRKYCMIFRFPFLIFFKRFPYWYATGLCQERKQEWKPRSTYATEVSGVPYREDMAYLIDSKQIHWQPKHLAPLIFPRHLRNWKICTHNYAAFQVAYIESVESRGHEICGEFEGVQSSFQRSWICDVCLVKH